MVKRGQALFHTGLNATFSVVCAQNEIRRVVASRTEFLQNRKGGKRQTALSSAPVPPWAGAQAVETGVRGTPEPAASKSSVNRRSWRTASRLTRTVPRTLAREIFTWLPSV